MSALWTAAEAAAATGGRATGDWSARGVAIDSREIAPGDLFVALRDARDGHEFAAAALEAGAAAALVDHRPETLPANAPLLEADETLEGLRALGAAARARLDDGARVIGVTGSVGKTGVKEMLRVMLAGQGPAHAAARSFNNHWGVPLTLARMPRATRFAAIEIGMNHAGEIAPLTRLARPHVALITTIAPAHLGHFSGEAAVADAKAEIFEGLEPGGVAVLNRDNRWFDRLAEAARGKGAQVVSFGTAEGCDARLLAQAAHRGVMVARARIGGRELMFKLAAPGAHLALNALGALAAAQAAGADLAQAALDLAQWRPPAGRGARWRVLLGPQGMDGAYLLIDDSYNANPASVAAALEVLAGEEAEHGVGRVARGRRIACLGDMMELGEEELALHRALADLPMLGRVDLVLTVGERMKALHEALPRQKRGGWFATAAEAAARLHRMSDAGDVILVKGSLSTGMGRVVEALKRGDAAEPADPALEEA